jgi:hypothetical protein
VTENFHVNAEEHEGLQLHLFLYLNHRNLHALHHLQILRIAPVAAVNFTSNFFIRRFQFMAEVTQQEGLQGGSVEVSGELDDVWQVRGHGCRQLVALQEQLKERETEQHGAHQEGNKNWHSEPLICKWHFKLLASR